MSSEKTIPKNNRVRISGFWNKTLQALKLKEIYQGAFKPNPYQRLTSQSRKLPDFIIIGAMRAGTTTVHHLLNQHPDVFPAVKKEIHYFDHNFRKGESWYRAHFPPRGLNAPHGQKLTGEATPYYLYHPMAPYRVRRVLPHIKLIVILRDPVERAYSHYWHSVKLGFETLPFDAALESETDRLKGEAEIISAEETYKSHPHQHQSYVARGRYSEQFSVWFDEIPRENFLILEQKTFFQDWEVGTTALFDFLGLPARSSLRKKKYNQGAYPPMDGQTQKKLAASFKTSNEALFEMLGRRYDWIG